MFFSTIRNKPQINLKPKITKLVETFSVITPMEVEKDNETMLIAFSSKLYKSFSLFLKKVID